MKRRPTCRICGGPISDESITRALISGTPQYCSRKHRLAAKGRRRYARVKAMRAVPAHTAHQAPALSREEVLALMERHQLSVIQFAGMAGLSPPTLFEWLKQRKRESLSPRSRAKVLALRKILEQA